MMKSSYLTVFLLKQHQLFSNSENKLETGCHVVSCPLQLNQYTVAFLIPELPQKALHLFTQTKTAITELR